MNRTLYTDKDDNALRFSNVRKIEASLPFSGFAIKFVISGNETYYIQNQKYGLSENQYIVGNQASESTVIINSKAPVQGLCIDVSENILREVIAYQLVPNPSFLEFLMTDKLLINQYSNQNSTLGHFLQGFSQNLDKNSPYNQELFYRIAEYIVWDQKQVFEQYDRLPFKKKATNQCLYRQLAAIKEWMDEQPTAEINLDDLAQKANISKYHFLRLFKTVFKISPYQYLLQKRLELAFQLLKTGIPSQEIAYQVGFADLQSFSKAFKQQFGYPPSYYYRVI